MKFQGLASRTETPYDMGWYTETIARGAFKKSLSENPDVVLNIQHGGAGSGLPIARTTAGNLRLSESYDGLEVDAELDPLDPDVQLVARKMQNGNLDGQMSFAFSIPEGRQKWSEDYTQRRILEANIHRGDCAIVVQGANPHTTSSLRNYRAALAAAGGGVGIRGDSRDALVRPGRPRLRL
jgi:HK97 family phage prohead protease